MPQANRFNAGKVDFTLVPLDGLEEEARVWAFGAKKYGRNNWEKLWGDETIRVVCASLLRHTYAIMRGESVDPESGLSHAAHIACNSRMLHRHHILTQETLKSADKSSNSGEKDGQTSQD